MSPQWQTVNAGSWNDIEKASRDYAIKCGIKLSTWSGTLDVMQLPDSTDYWHSIFLDWNTNRDPMGKLQVPKIFYKILADEVNEKGIVLLGKILFYFKFLKI